MKILSGGLVKCPFHPCVTVSSTAEEHANHAAEIHGQAHAVALSEVRSAVEDLRNGHPGLDKPAPPAPAPEAEAPERRYPPQRVFTCSRCGKSGHRKGACPAAVITMERPVTTSPLIAKSVESSSRSRDLATALLAELRTRRDLIDQTITHIEGLKDAL